MIEEGRSTRLALILVSLLILLYALTFSVLSILRHQTLHSNAFDLGNMDQAVWNTLQGRILRFTNWEGGDTRFAAHVEPILIPISLLYLLRSDPQTLLVFQSLVLALGAWPAFWLAKEKLESALAGFVFALAYLLFPALEAANVSDFHAVSLTAAFLLYAFYFLQRKNYAWFALFAFLSLTCKEEISLILLLMGLYIVVFQGEWRVGLVTMVVGALWFYLSMYVVIPHFNVAGKSAFLERYQHLGSNPGEMAVTLLTHPIYALKLVFASPKRAYLFGLLAGGGFLPLLAPEIAILGAPSLAINLLSSSEWMYSGGAHYSAPVVPLIIVAGIYGLARLSDRLSHRSGMGRRRLDRAVRLSSPSKPRRGRLVNALSLLTLVLVLYNHRQRGFSPLARGIELPTLTAHYRLVQRFAAMIPQDASVSAQTALNPHVSQRENLCIFPQGLEADYIFLDVTTSTYPLSIAEHHQQVQEVLGSGKYHLLAAEDGYLLLQKGAGEAISLPQGFYSFAKVEASSRGSARGEPLIQHPFQANFADQLQLLGYDVQRADYLFGRKSTYRFTLYWRALKQMKGDYLIALFFSRDDGALVYSLAKHPTTIWYPTSRWRQNEVVRIETGPVTLRGIRRGGVLVSVVAGQNQWDITDRLRPITSEEEIELFEEGTLLKLTTLRP